MKVYLLNPKDGAPITNWWDGSTRWNLAVGEVKAFPAHAGELLKGTFGFLQQVSLEEYEDRIEKEIEPEVKKELEEQKELIASSTDAEPASPDWSELPRGELINECRRTGREVKGLSQMKKEQLINLLNSPVPHEKE